MIQFVAAPGSIPGARLAQQINTFANQMQQIPIGGKKKDPIGQLLFAGEVKRMKDKAYAGQWRAFFTDVSRTAEITKAMQKAMNLTNEEMARLTADPDLWAPQFEKYMVTHNKELWETLIQAEKDFTSKARENPGPFLKSIFQVEGDIMNTELLESMEKHLGLGRIS